MTQKAEPSLEENINLCNSITGISIKKVIIKNINTNETKLIFVGPQSNQIKALLTKLENKIQLSKKEQRELAIVIPFYTKKFGILDEYNIYFVYKYFEENITIYHAKIILCEIIKERLNAQINEKDFYPDNILLYKYVSNIDYKYYINILNYIFDGEKELSNTDFLSKLQKFTFKNKAELNLLLKKVLPSKFIDSLESTFLNKEKFYYDDCINNDELFHIFLNNPIILSNKYTFINSNILLTNPARLGNTKYTYYGYQNIDYIINTLKDAKVKTNKAKDFKFFIEQNLTVDNLEHPYQNLDSYNKTNNNEYFLITHADLKKYIPENILTYYFPNTISENINKSNSKLYSKLYSKLDSKSASKKEHDKEHDKEYDKEHDKEYDKEYDKEHEKKII